MWECCQCLNVKAGISEYCGVCGHSKCSACFEVKVPDKIKDENEQLYYFEIKKTSKADIYPSPLELAHLKTHLESFKISEKRAREILEIAGVMVSDESVCIYKYVSTPGSNSSAKKETTPLEENEAESGFEVKKIIEITTLIIALIVLLIIVINYLLKLYSK